MPQVTHTGVTVTAEHLRNADYARGLRDAWQIVERAIRPLGVPRGSPDSSWNAGYTCAKREAQNAIHAALLATAPEPSP